VVRKLLIYALHAKWIYWFKISVYFRKKAVPLHQSTCVKYTEHLQKQKKKKNYIHYVNVWSLFAFGPLYAMQPKCLFGAEMSYHTGITSHGLTPFHTKTAFIIDIKVINCISDWFAFFSIVYQGFNFRLCCNLYFCRFVIELKEDDMLHFDLVSLRLSKPKQKIVKTNWINSVRWWLMPTILSIFFFMKMKTEDAYWTD